MTKVFVYGSLKQGGWLHGHLAQSKFVKEDVLDGFRMEAFGAFPVAIPCSESKISGEVYEIDSTTLSGLDWAEGYPHFYDRKQVGDTWVYFQEAPESRTEHPNLVENKGVYTWTIQQ